MIRTLAFAGLVLALTGCNSTTYYAEGISVAARDRDLAQCEAEARASYPPRLVTRLTPRVFHPGSSTCDATGVCVTEPPYWTGRTPYQEDLNEDIRDRAVVGCMGGRGYAQVSLPICERDAAVTPSVIMAPLGADTCLLRNGGTSLIVAP